MKKLWILAVIVMMVTFASSVQAEVRAGAFSFGLNAGYYLFEGNQGYKDNYTLGLRAGYNFTENIGAEVFGNWVPSEFKDIKGDPDNRVYVAGIEGLYHFMPGSRFVPFLAIGIGAIHYSSSDSKLVPSKFTVDYGAGLKYFVTDNFSLRADVRHVLPLGEKDEYGDNPNFVHNDLLATLGISYDFGGEKKQIVEAKVEEQYNPASEPVPAPKPAPVPEPTPAPAPVPEPTPAPVPVKEKVIITLNVEFNTGKTIVNEKYYDDIKRVADFMKEYPDSTAVIEGHTDNVDTHHEPERNMRLSQARADNVRKYLVDKFGIDGSRLTAKGYGGKAPIAGNDTAEGRKKNRRVEAVIEGIKTVK